ncbi:MAG: hypothetical protein WB580_03840 [Candidatus Binataceae bacterium]
MALKTDDWVCLSDWFSLYYLRFAAQAYYNHILYIADIVVPGGVTTYPWLQFVPGTYVARAFGAGPFAVNLIWTFLSAIGLSAGLYFVFGVSSNRPGWRPDARCSASRTTTSPPRVTTQLQILASALWFHPRSLVVIHWGLLSQWRIPDPGLNLPRAGAFSPCRGGGRVVIWKSRRFDLLYVWSLVAGGILLSRSRVVSGIFFTNITMTGYGPRFGWSWF